MIKTMRGELIDFDLLKIKQSIQRENIPKAVNDRSDYIDSKLQNRVKAARADIAKAKAKVELNKEVEQENTKPVIKKIKKVKISNDKAIKE